MEYNLKHTIHSGESLLLYWRCIFWDDIKLTNNNIIKIEALLSRRAWISCRTKWQWSTTYVVLSFGLHGITDMRNLSKIWSGISRIDLHIHVVSQLKNIYNSMWCLSTDFGMVYSIYTSNDNFTEQRYLPVWCSVRFELYSSMVYFMSILLYLRLEIWMETMQFGWGHRNVMWYLLQCGYLSDYCKQ